MLIVGQGGVGKTSLVRRLMYDDVHPHENKTGSIAIPTLADNCDGTEIRLNVGDFGGQKTVGTLQGLPAVEGRPGVSGESMDPDHVIFRLDEGARLRVGDQVTLTRRSRMLQ